MDKHYQFKGSFSNAENALQKLPVIHPDIVLIDISLGDGMSGIECAKALRPQHPDMLFMM
jgi:DNA-binding NarL/FixJ family response regulator